MKATLSMDEEY